MADNDMFTNAFHIEQGEVRMYLTDATVAVGQFPEEWSFAPWSDEAIAAWKAKNNPAPADQPAPAPAPTGKASKGG